MPKISIITVNYNNAEGLAQTIANVGNQSITDFEYIVVDGNSSDGSKEIITQNQEVITRWLSEADSGVYEAMNKGIRMASGDYVLFLNSGDTLRHSNVLKEVSGKIKGDKDLYYGNLMFIGREKEILTEYPEKLNFVHFIERSLPHPGTFIKKELFETIFYYSEDYRIVSDWEFFIYAICIEDVTYEHLNMIISNFDMQGMSNDPKNKAKIYAERMLVFQKHFPKEYEKLLEQRPNPNKNSKSRKMSALWRNFFK